jgi:hypothetical protein
MIVQPPPNDAKCWFHRAVALTLAVGACVGLLFAARPGYGAFFVTSTLAFLAAGFIWSPSPPPAGGRREPRQRCPARLGGQFGLARSYRITTAR